MGALTRLMGKSGDSGDSGDSTAGSKSSSSPLDTVKKMFGKKRGGSGGGGSGGGNTDDPGAPSYHSGGKVRKTGLARLRKGEQVLTKTQFKRLKGRGKSRGKRR